MLRHGTGPELKMGCGDGAAVPGPTRIGHTVPFDVGGERDGRHHALASRAVESLQRLAGEVCNEVEVFVAIQHH